MSTLKNEHKFSTPVLIIGSGGAGLRTAIELHDQGHEVIVVGKCKKREAHTSWATGGINASLATMDPKDTWQLHAADTIKDGGYINDPEAVKTLCQHAPQAVNELAEWGTPFHREEDGRITQRFFGAATYRRACFIGDYTGRAILNTLVDQAEKRNITFHSETYITKLLQADDGAVAGAVGINLNTQERKIYHAQAVVLATGGHSRMFARSSSHFWEGNGDGIYLAAQCGAQFMDMEMFQFHPTGMIWPEEAAGLLVTEAVRGEGGFLTNNKGERFMERYDKERMELSARDIVARAIFTEIQEGRGTENGGVYLDISHKEEKYIKERLPKMCAQFKQYCGIDITKEKMEVAPTAHYSMGGIKVKQGTGETGVPGLYAVGEVTSGVHGGNRLGGNSLAEIMVFGRLTGKYLSQQLSSKEPGQASENTIQAALEDLNETLNSKGPHNAENLIKEVQSVMSTKVGVIRTEKEMTEAHSLIKELAKNTLNVDESAPKSIAATLNLRAAFPTCEMIIKSALTRQESRAAHHRSDFPEKNESWHKNIICSPTTTALKISTAPIPPISPEVSKFLTGERAIHHLE